MFSRIKWVMDPAKTRIGFNLKHLVSDISGAFKTFDAVLFTDGVDFTSTEISFWLHADSIETGQPVRNQFLKSSEFFNVNQFQYIKFISSSISKTGTSGVYELNGDLIIKEICKPVKFNMEFTGMNNENMKEKVGFRLQGKINRRDWRLNWQTPNQFGMPVLSEEIALNCNIELVKSEMINENSDSFFPRELPLTSYKRAS
ncbi:MAG: YceI family protein [Bacteroidia bacterium]